MGLSLYNLAIRDSLPRPIAYRLRRRRDWRWLWLRRRDEWSPVFEPAIDWTTDTITISLSTSTYSPVPPPRLSFDPPTSSFYDFPPEDEVPGLGYDRRAS